MKKNTLTIVLTGGGSGGHITPLLSLAHALKVQDPQCRVVYFGLKGEKLEGLQERYQAFDEVCLVPSGKFRRYHGQGFLAYLIDVKSLALNVRDFFKVLAGIWSARKQLTRVKPDVVFSKGSFVAVPVGVAAHQLGIPIVTHDSDAVPGLANRIIGRWAAVHAVGQPADNYSYPKESIKFTGVPIDERITKVTRSDQKAYKSKLGLDPDGLTLLVVGGGLGSGWLNQTLYEIADKLHLSLPELEIILFSGQQHQAQAQRQYQDMPWVKVVGFSDEFYVYSGAADLIITRAGATALAEFAVQAKPCVVIPAAQLTGGHQLANGKTLTAAGAAVVLGANAGPAALLRSLESLLRDGDQRKNLSANLTKFAKPTAAADLSKVILEVAAG